MDFLKSKKQKTGELKQIAIESMTTTKTSDVEATVAQIHRLEQAGCDIIRVAVPDIASAEAISEIKERISIPLIADIHFDHKLALRAVDAGADKIRINPGNIGTPENIKAVAKACNQKNIPIRVGSNSGSLSKEILAKHGGVTPEAMAESTLNHVALLNKFDFDNIWISAKTSSVPLTVKTYRLLNEQTDYPFHIGITEAGTEYNGIIKSSIGIGTLLLDGIGNTIRVSLTAEPEKEIEAAKAILKALGLRPGIDIISCPTCGRCNIDIIAITNEVEGKLKALFEKDNSLTIAIMGCAVNGPGEAGQADYGIAGGNGEGIIFAKGKIIKKVPMDRLVKELCDIIQDKGTVHLS
ncbi:MAG: flavodoxin-dependent (E)-4-hydroxy-3-methylbut-2-enyl-diphosphate synthase [Oscillospiraceae bacterium]|nr:flavodoxin-dependent (E)-4-hydroxy-3-methylbut-2-enyl-diphosphate synthase [Oscillospiraceae bacterium]